MNIYQLQQDLISVFDRIEENGGELTPELEKELSIKQDEFKEKVENYTKVIKLIEQDLNAIKEEKKRLTDLAASKQKIIDRLTKVIIEAINNFGETKKSGVKYLDYGTGSVSIRSSKAVNVAEDFVDHINCAIQSILQYNKNANQLDVLNKIDADDVIQLLQTDATASEIGKVDLNVSIKIPVSSMFDGSSYNAIKELVKYTDNLDIKPSVNKIEFKKELESNGSCMPNLARLVINQSIQIK